MHLPVEWAEDDADCAARVSVRQLLDAGSMPRPLRSVMLTLMVMWTPTHTLSSGAVQRRCCSWWASTRCPRRLWVNVLAPMIDTKGILSRCEPRQLAFDGAVYEWLPITGGDGPGSAPELKTTLPPYAELTPLQQSAVSAVSAVSRVDASCWTSATFSATLKNWGLPGDKVEVDQCIEGKECKRDADQGEEGEGEAGEEELPEKESEREERCVIVINVCNRAGL
jgi:hypothetical protein